MTLTLAELEQIRRNQAGRGDAQAETGQIGAAQVDSTSLPVGGPDLTEAEKAEIQASIQGQKPDRLLPTPWPIPTIRLPDAKWPGFLRPYTVAQPSITQQWGGTKKLPGDFLETLGSIASTGMGLLTDPIKRQKAIDTGKTVAKGISRYMLPSYMNQAFTPESKAVKAAGEAIVNRLQYVYQEPGEAYKESPVETLGMWSMVTGAMGPAGQMVDPVSLAFRGALKTSKAITSKIAKGMTERAAKATGAGAASIDVARDVGRGGDPMQVRIFKEAQAGIRNPITLANKMRDAASEARKWVSDKYDAAMLDVARRNPGLRLDKKAIETDVLAGLEAEGFRVSLDDILDAAGNPTGKKTVSISPAPDGVWVGLTQAELLPIKKMVKIISEWTDDSVEGIHNMRKSMDKLRNSTGNFSVRDDIAIVVGDARDVAGSSLKDVEGFKETDEMWTAAANFLEGMEDALGIRKGRSRGAGVARLDVEEVPAISATAYTKIGNALNDRTSQNLEATKWFIKELDNILTKRTGSPSSILTEMAGIRLSKEAPQGIAGAARQRGANKALVSAVGASLGLQAGGDVLSTMAGFVGGAAVDTMWNILRGMTVENPVSVGKFFRGLGTTERVTKKLIEVVEEFKRTALGTGLGTTVTMGLILDRMIERENKSTETSSFLDDIGSISRVPTTLTVP